MVIGQLLKPMFETVDNSKSPFSGGHGEQAFKPMIVDEMAKKIAAGGGFGLAQPIYAQMLRMQEGVPR
jgi:Rod binding domain-containing protein